MAQTSEIKASARAGAGQGAARAVRREGRVPAILYGDGKEPQNLAVDAKEITLLINKGKFLSTVFELDIDGKRQRAIPREVQVDPVKDKPIHLDFQRVGKDSKIRVNVPVRFVNELLSPGLKRGGVLNVVRHRVELLCPADGIPDKIVADLAGLEINDSLHISSVALPEGVRPTIARDFTIATIAAPAGVKEELRAAAAAASGPAAAAEGADAKAEGGDAKKADGAKSDGKK